MAINHFDDVGMINFINNNYNYHHQQLLINFSKQAMPAAASTTFMIHHGIFASTIPTAAKTLVQMQYPDEVLFHTHPIIITLAILYSVIAYSLAFSLDLLLRGTRHDGVRPSTWSIASGSISLASLLGLLFSPPSSSSWPWLPVLFCFLLFTLLVFSRNWWLWRWVNSWDETVCGGQVHHCYHSITWTSQADSHEENIKGQPLSSHDS